MSTVAQCQSSVEPKCQLNWDEPVPLGQMRLPPYPIEAIPSNLAHLGAYCAAVAESYQVPIDMPAMLALAVAAAAQAKRIEVHVRGDHREPVNLFMAVTMEPGNRKSAVFSAMQKPLTDFEREETIRLAPLIDQNQNDRAILEAELRHRQQLAAKGKKPEEREQAKGRAKELVDILRNMPIVAAPRYLVDDATPERLASLLQAQGGRIALLSPEGDTFDLMAGRYSSTGAPNLGVYLKGHAGDDIRVDRINRPAEHIHRPALTIGLAVQPAVLRGLMTKPGFRGRGLLGRFLYSMPASLLGRRRITSEPVPPDLAAAYDKLIRDALALKPVNGEDGRSAPRIVRVGPEALIELDRFARWIERELGPDGTLASMGDWAGKVVGAVCRIAGVFHGLEHARTGNPEQFPIDAETLLCAITIGEYLVEHARAAYFEMGSDPCIDLARRLLEQFARDKTTRFTRREAHRWVEGSIRKADELDEPLQLLESHGYIRGVENSRQGPGRKPSPQYDVNPAVHRQNRQNRQEEGPEGNFVDCVDSVGEVEP